MKKLFNHPIIFIVLLFLSPFVMAQSNKEDIDIIQSAFGKDKKELVRDYMELSGKDSAAFWKLYDEYEDKRKVIGRERINLLEQYANGYQNLDNAKAEKLATAILSNDAKYNNLHQTYFKKFSEILGARNAAKFLQLEIYVQTYVRANVMREIPLIGDLDKQKQ
jgi:hypothetical protein